MLSPAEYTRVAEQLQYFGCSKRDTDIYVQCLQMGPASVQDIARKLRRNRVTVHSAVEQMIEEELLFETRKGKRRLIVAEQPTGLFRLLQKKRNELDRVRQNLEFIAPMLTALQARDASIPTVKLYEGVEGFKRMLEETLSAKGDLLVFSNVDLFSKLVSVEYLEPYFERRAARGIHTRLIFPPCAFAERVNAKAKAYKIQVRLFPGSDRWRSGIFAWNDCIALLSYTEQKLTCTIIENKDIAHFYRTMIFELCWQQAMSVATDVAGKPMKLK